MTEKQHHRVGYEHPPQATRFKPGVSGNPSGRPKKIPSFLSELHEELGESTTSEGGRKISNARAIAKTAVAEAIGGNMRAIVALLAFFAKQPGDAADAQQGSATADAEILADFLNRELRRRGQENDMKNNELANLENEDSKS